MVNGRLIYAICRKLFYTICHICIKNLYYHRRQAWTRLNNHLRGPYPYNSYHHFRTPADRYLDKRKQLYFVCHLSFQMLKHTHVQLEIYFTANTTQIDRPHRDCYVR